MIDLFDLPRTPPKSPKLFLLREIGVKHAMKYNEMWHSRLPITSHSNMIRNKHFVFYGAEYQDHCFAVGMWTDPVAGNRMNKEHVWLELRRLAISPDAPKFSATWMLSKMIKQIRTKYPDVTKLVSYQDTDVHKGTIYAAGNWQKDNVSKFQNWETTKRKRNALQSHSDKIRWVYPLC